MQAKLAKAFDECLARIKRGEAVKACLAEYPHLSRQLVPLLYTALSIETAPKVLPSDDFRKLSKERLMARLRQEAMQAERSHQAKAASDSLGILWRELERVITGPAKIAIPVTLALIIALQGLFLFGTPKFITPSPAPALASRCTITTFTGSAEMQRPGSTIWEKAENGMTLVAGSRVKTNPNSQALLTFFNGTTLILESGTDLVVEQMEGIDENQPTVIVVKQRLGKTWSQVTKLEDPAHYEVQTPSASAVVHGTLFVTKVDETGATRVQTIEGLVGVSAQGEEVYLPAGKQTSVEPGTPPSEPILISLAGHDSAGDIEMPGNQPLEKVVTTKPTSERAELLEATGQDPDNEVAPEQHKAELPAQDPDSGEPPSQDQERLPWKDQYEMWLVAVIIGVVLFSFGLTVIMWRKQ